MPIREWFSGLKKFSELEPKERLELLFHALDFISKHRDLPSVELRELYRREFAPARSESAIYSLFDNLYWLGAVRIEYRGYPPHTYYVITPKGERILRRGYIIKEDYADAPEWFIKRLERWRLMWRLTVALNYVIHNNYYSYKITGYFRTEEEANKKINEFREKVIEAVKKITGYGREEWWFSDEPNIELETIPYDERYIGTIEEKDETVLVKNLRSQRRLIEKKRSLHIPLSRF